MDINKIKKFTSDYIRFLDKNETVSHTQLLKKLPSYVMPLESFNEITGTDFADAFQEDSDGLKELFTTTLSDNTILTVCKHDEAEELISVVEYPDEKLAWSVYYDEEELKAVFHARLPKEYVFAIKEYDKELSICILPKFVADSFYRKIPSNFTDEIGDVGPMWETPWFNEFYKENLKTSYDNVFEPTNKKVTKEEMKRMLEDLGLINDLDVERLFFE